MTAASGGVQADDTPQHDPAPATGPAPALVVLDANVQLDLWLFDDPQARPLQAALRARQVVAVASAPMLDEQAEVLGRPLATGWPVAPPAALEAARQHLQLVAAATTGTGPRCQDPDDQIYIDLAWQLGAAWLVTRDRALLALARAAAPRGLRIGAPAAWAAAHAAAQAPAGGATQPGA